MNRQAILRASLAVFAALWLPTEAHSQTNAGPVPMPRFAADGPPVTILSEQDMESIGIFYPDMPLGVVRGPTGNYFMLGAGASFGRFGPGRNTVPQGTYKFTGTLDHFRPAEMNGRWPQPSMVSGERERSPDGSDFDRDYAGGGPTYPLRDPRTNQAVLLLLYHGEYHATAQGDLFYGASGLAVSTNTGDSFTKIGEILSPHMMRADFFARQTMGGVTADGSLVEADANGNAIGPGTAPDDRYYYAVFSDRKDFSAKQNLAIARIKEADLMDAIAQRRTPHFMKFFSPAGIGGDAAAHFAEPGVGGQSTYIVSENAYDATPGVYYDSDLGRFVLCYDMGQQNVVLRTASNLLHWSDPVIVANPPANSGTKIFYPSLVGTGADPTILGKEFYLYYLQRQMPGNRAVSLQRVSVH